MQEKALEVASHITHPVTAAVFSVVVAASAFGLAIRAKKTRVAWVLAIAIVLLGLAPLVATTYLQARGVYRIRIVALGLDKQPVSDAEVSSSVGGELKKGDDTWELDIPPQTRPSDGVVDVTASVKTAYLAGSTRIVLAGDYYPAYSIQLESLPSVMISGNVYDEHDVPVVGAQVAIEGFPEIVKTNEMGFFQIDAHAAQQQPVYVIVKKGGLVVRRKFAAGSKVSLTLAKEKQPG